MTGFKSTVELFHCLCYGRVGQIHTRLRSLVKISGVDSVFSRHMAATTDVKDVGTSGESQQSSTERFTPFYGKLSPFSQHHLCHFKLEGNSYCSAEQYMMYQKAVVFKDDEIAKKIMKSKNPVEQKRFGRKVKFFDPNVWNEQCEDVVRRANEAKFYQNADLKSALLKTSGSTLVEASPRDTKWGVGLGVTNPKVHDRKNWRGKNLLGQILTSLRNKFEKEMEQDSEKSNDDNKKTSDDTKKPGDGTEKPSDVNEKSSDCTKKPSDGIEKPSDGTEKPRDGTAKPRDGIENPSDGIENPSDGTEKPSDGTAKPSDGTAKPSDGTEKPSDGTAKPSDGTEKPSDGTAKPDDNTDMTEKSSDKY